MTRVAIIAVALALALAATFWAFFAIGVPFEEGGGELCIGSAADLAQQVGAVLGWLCAVTAASAAVRDARATWGRMTAAGATVFGLWWVGTQLAANANC